MNANDTLQVVVTVGGNSAQAPLSAYFIVSPKADGQTVPSPFLNNSKYLCYLALTPTSQSGQQYTFSSSLLTVPTGTAAGSFELTLVIQDSTGAQWSEDPEFDTTGN